MHIVDQIFEALGEATKIATAINEPVQTVHSWKAKGKIPHWRRPRLIELARQERAELPADCLEYLARSDRSSRKAAA